MISPDLLAILRCPETRQPLAWADGETLAAVNARIAAGQARNGAGEPVGEALAEALVTADHGRLYPVRAGIPILLVEEALVL